MLFWVKISNRTQKSILYALREDRNPMYLGNITEYHIGEVAIKAECIPITYEP